jgi:hypothetical protein
MSAARLARAYLDEQQMERQRGALPCSEAAAAPRLVDLDLSSAVRPDSGGVAGANPGVRGLSRLARCRQRSS